MWKAADAPCAPAGWDQTEDVAGLEAVVEGPGKCHDLTNKEFALDCHWLRAAAVLGWI